MSLATILVTGDNGQLATALGALRSRYAWRVCTRDEADLTVRPSLEAAVACHRPVMVVNAGAYTAVDGAESDAAAAFAINADGPGTLADVCHQAGIPLIHISTDYVFDGNASQPYAVDHPVAPLGVYGASKAAGDDAVRAAIAEHVIVRTAWLYGETGQNFVTTMLRLASGRRELGVVDDQTGSPTYASDLATAIDRIAGYVLERAGPAPWGTWHVTNAGATTWCGFARAIFAVAGRYGHPVPQVRAITTADYPTAARRPAYSVLDTSGTADRFGISLPPWLDALERCIANIFANSGADS